VFELPLTPSLIKRGNHKRGSGAFSPDGVLGVSPRSLMSPNVWGASRGFGYCFPLSRVTTYLTQWGGEVMGGDY